MPRLSDKVWNRRRRHVLTSAWIHFSRDGFHATSMDQVIAGTGMSANTVYRYFRSKDELIDATVDEALAEAEALFGGLLATEPPPGPDEALHCMVGAIRARRDQDYDLSRLAMQAWTEALRRPHLRARVAGFYASVQASLEQLAARWRDAGLLAADAEPRAVAQVLTTLLPGLVVMEQLRDGSHTDRLGRGLAAFNVTRARDDEVAGDSATPT